MMQLAANLSHTINGAWPVIAGAVFLTGCAGGAWLERPLAAELPVEAPAKSYPTAVRGPTSLTSAQTANSTAGLSAESMGAAAIEATAAHKPSIETPLQAAQNLDRPQPLVPALAVVPPEFIPTRRPADAESGPHHPPEGSEPYSHPASVAGSLSLPGSASIEPHPATQTAAWQLQIPSYLPTQTATVAETEVAPNMIPAAAAQQTTVSDLPIRLDKARSELIVALESEIRRRRDVNASDEEIPRLEQHLRLVYLTDGRLDDAVAAVESLDPQQQEAFKNLMFGLGVWLSPDEARRVPLRSAKVLHSLRDATSELAAASKLELKNLVFCERVDYFGWYTEFPKKEFQPKQQVILYVEVENFAAEEKGPAGYETELQGSYEILDGSGQIIASRQLQLDKEICRNYRRDYFLAYRIYMPENITPGRYRLELTVEDLKARGKYQGRKLGEGMIEFSVR